MVYRLNWLNLILNSNQGLVLFKQTWVFRSTRNKNLQKQNNRFVFIPVLNPCLHFTKNKFIIPTYIEETVEQPIILNKHIKLDFSSNNGYFYSFPHKNISDKFTIIRTFVDFFRQVSFLPQDLKRNCVIIPNDWTHKLEKKLPF